MFTGIVEELGTVTAVEQDAEVVRLTIDGTLVTSDAAHGDSIAVNGVCLTVVDSAEGRFTVDVVQETVRRSAIKSVGVGDRVNLERAMALGDRLGGHIVQGHVDGTAAVGHRGQDGLTRFDLPGHLARYLVAKGSVTVDGVSLTVMAVTDDTFSVGLIPTTLKLTVLGAKAVGDLVNLEVDIIAKYVEKMLGGRRVQ